MMIDYIDNNYTEDTDTGVTTEIYDDEEGFLVQTRTEYKNGIKIIKNYDEDELVSERTEYPDKTYSITTYIDEEKALKTFHYNDGTYKTVIYPQDDPSERLEEILYGSNRLIKKKKVSFEDENGNDVIEIHDSFKYNGENFTCTIERYIVKDESEVLKTVVEYNSLDETEKIIDETKTLKGFIKNLINLFNSCFDDDYDDDEEDDEPPEEDSSNLEEIIEDAESEVEDKEDNAFI